MLDWLSKIMDHLCTAVGALIFVQFPMFFEQYLTRLSGHVNELHYQVKHMTETAKQFGKTLPQYIEIFLTSSNPIVVKQGGLMEELVHRSDKLSDAYASIYHANPFTRPFVFLYHSDWEIVRATASSYHFGFTLTFESIIYALVGMLIGYYLYKVLSIFFRKVSSGFNRARKKEAH